MELTREEVQGMIQAAVAGPNARLSTILSVFGPTVAGGHQTSNISTLIDGATTNGEGVGGPTICALLQTTAKASGMFLWWASACQPAAAATEVCTMTVTMQDGAGAVTLTGNGVGTGLNAQVATAAAGTGIVITAGGGDERTLAAPSGTVGTAAVGAAFSAGGLNSFQITKGNNVFLCLKWTNSATNRVVSSMSLGLIELPC